MTATKPVFIEGTGKSLDYLVIAQHDNVRLALKPIIENLTGEDFDHLTMIGFRLRSVAAEGVAVTPAALTEAWPSIEFRQCSTVRASCTLGDVINKELVNTPLALKAFLEENHTAHAYATQLAEMIGEDALTETAFTIEQFLADVYTATVDKSFPECEFDEAAKKLGCNVIDLQAASLARAAAKLN